jgi:ferredoxin-like protein FixX
MRRSKLTLSRYHCKCLETAPSEFKDVDNYSCPICDWRVKIPRDAARPELEDLQDWAAEMEELPFQPEEEDVLKSIIQQASDFREILKPYLNPMAITTSEIPTQIFWLRKIEGAEILLAYETNFFRQELHQMNPIAPDPPPILQESLSTRKPRPTKQQKLMAQYGIEHPKYLPQHLRIIQPRSASGEHALPNPLYEFSRNQLDFPCYHDETEMTWGDHRLNSGLRSDPPLFPPIFTIAPLTRPSMDPSIFSLNDPAVDEIPMFKQMDPPEDELFANVNFDEADGDEEGLGPMSHAMNAMNSAIIEPTSIRDSGCPIRNVSHQIVLIQWGILGLSKIPPQHEFQLHERCNTHPFLLRPLFPEANQQPHSSLNLFVQVPSPPRTIAPCDIFSEPINLPSFDEALPILPSISTPVSLNFQISPAEPFFHSDVKPQRGRRRTNAKRERMKPQPKTRPKTRNLKGKFSCKLCPAKTFKRRENLKRHVKTHSKLQPFTCEVCGKAFSRDDNRKVHYRTHI